MGGSQRCNLPIRDNWCDHPGSARMVIDSAGVVKDKYKRYFAYGGGASQTVSTGQKYQYTGQPYDDNGAFDLYYYGARYYDPVLGRFTSTDPVGAKYPSLSPYQYAGDDPIGCRDVNGLWIKPENANAFVKAAIAYRGTPYNKMDCSKLVLSALGDIQKQGITTAFYLGRNKIPNITGTRTGNFLNAAGKGLFGLATKEFSLANAKVGDLLIAPGHVEIIIAVTGDGIITVKSSDNKKQPGVALRENPINPNDPSSYNLIFKEKPVLIEITEDTEGKDDKAKEKDARHDHQEDTFEGWGPQNMKPPW